MDIISEAFKYLVERSDPILVICMLILGVWQHRTAKVLADHIDNRNMEPHPQITQAKAERKMLQERLEIIHRENREDHQEIFRLLRKDI